MPETLEQGRGCKVHDAGSVCTRKPQGQASAGSSVHLQGMGVPGTQRMGLHSGCDEACRGKTHAIGGACRRHTLMAKARSRFDALEGHTRHTPCWLSVGLLLAMKLRTVTRGRSMSPTMPGGGQLLAQTSGWVGGCLRSTRACATATCACPGPPWPTTWRWRCCCARRTHPARLIPT